MMRCFLLNKHLSFWVFESSRQVVNSSAHVWYLPNIVLGVWSETKMYNITWIHLLYGRLVGLMWKQNAGLKGQSSYNHSRGWEVGVEGGYSKWKLFMLFQLMSCGLNPNCLIVLYCLEACKNVNNVFSINF
jgi:hypothetical protein